MADFNPYKMAQEQFDDAAEILSLSKSEIALLRKPMRELIVHFPVRMDDGSIQVFEGYRIRHNTALGPAKGGLRWHPDETADTVRALSTWMTWKCALMGLPLGGGKGGIRIDARSLSLHEQERVARAFIRAIGHDIGASIDIPAPDINTNGQIMAWMLDEYETMKGYSEPGVITGKLVLVGGSKGRLDATSRGGIYVMEELAKTYKTSFKGKKTAIQGYGNAGYYAAQLAEEILQTKVVAIGNSRNALLNEKGLDLQALAKHYQSGGSLSGFGGAKEIGSKELLEVDCDLLIPSAVEGVINEHNAEKIKAKYILELANGPTTPQADRILEKKGVIVVPDFLANAGGVTVSYFEQVQNAQMLYWTEEEVRQELRERMASTFASVYKVMQARNLSMRRAAMVLAVDRVREACKLRGWV